MKKYSLEEELWRKIDFGEEYNLEDALLIVSGVSDLEELNKYKTKLDKIQKDFHFYYEKNWKGAAKKLVEEGFGFSENAISWYLLNEFVGHGKKENKEKGLYRYYNNLGFAAASLKRIVDSKSSINKGPIGNCVGLTSFMFCLAKRENLSFDFQEFWDHISILAYLENGLEVPIENTHIDGFNLFLNKNYSNDANLLAIVLDSRTISRYNINKKFEEAIRNFTRVIELNPKYAKAYCSRGFVFEENLDYENALKNYQTAIRLSPDLIYAKAGIERISEFIY